MIHEWANKPDAVNPAIASRLQNITGAGSLIRNVGRNRAYALTIRHLPDWIRRISDCRIPRLRDLDSSIRGGARQPDCGIHDTPAFGLGVDSGLPRGSFDPSPHRSDALVLESVRDSPVLGSPVLHRRHCQHSIDAMITPRTANKTLDRMTRSAVSRTFQIGHRWRAPRHRSALRSADNRT
jgi:hypothetical protein